jgi:hypothetical protein
MCEYAPTGLHFLLQHCLLRVQIFPFAKQAAHRRTSLAVGGQSPASVKGETHNDTVGWQSLCQLLQSTHTLTRNK